MRENQSFSLKSKLQKLPNWNYNRHLGKLIIRYPKPFVETRFGSFPLLCLMNVKLIQQNQDNTR